MQSVWYAAAGTGFTFLMTALGAAAVFFIRGKNPGKQNNSQRICLGFAAGVMIAATVWSLIMPSMDYAEGLPLPAWLPATAGIGMGAAFLMILEECMEHMRRRERLHGTLRSVSRGTAMLMTAITLHNIPEGMAVGLSYALAVQSGQPGMMLAASALALGIGVQNLPEGAAISLPMQQEGMKKEKAFWLGAMSAIVEPVFGILSALAVSISRPLLPWMLGFAAGAMLYVSVRELIPDACSRDDQYAGTIAVLAGFLLMMILDIALG